MRLSPRSRLFRFCASIGLFALLAGSAAAGQIGFVYALQQVNGGTNQIHGFRFDQSTGVLMLLPGFPVASGGTGTNGIVSEQLTYVDGRLYVINDGNDTLTAFSVNRSTGALTAMPFNPVTLGAANWNCVAVHPSGSPVVVGNSTGNLLSFVVTSTTATAAPGSPFSTGAARPYACGFSGDGTYVYTGGNLGSTFAGFSVNAGTGVLTPLAGSPFDSGGANPLGYATDGSGRLFSAMGNLAQVRAFTTASGVPTGVSGNPFTSGLTQATHAVMHPGGFYMVADRLGNRVGSYQIAGAGASTTLTAVSGSPFASGGLFTDALALTGDGAHLLAANGTSRNLTVFQVDASTGALTSIGVQAANTLGASGNISGLAFATGEAGFFYTLQQVNSGANQIHGFRINPSTGALTPIAGSPFAGGGNGGGGGNSELIAYRNGRLYVVNDGDDTFTAFKVNRTTGALTAAFGPVALGTGAWACISVHPSGSPVVVGNGSGGLSSFSVGATTATAAAGSPFSTGTARPFSCGFSRDGSFVYTGGNVGTNFAGFSVNSGTGVLTPLAGSPFDSGGANPVGYATDSSGRLYSASAGAAEVRAFTTSAGVPAGVSGNPFSSGLITAVHGVRHPAGFYMATDRSGNQVGVYRINGSGAATTLTAVSGSPFANGAGAFFPVTSAQTDDGAFHVAANSNSRNLTVFQVNPATGGLTSVGVQPANTLGVTGNTPGIAFVPIVPPFIDDPLTAFTSVIKAIHVMELRSRIDAARAQYGLGPYAYDDPTLTTAVTMVRAVHITDLRAALADVYTAVGMVPPPYTDPILTAGTTVVKVAHIAELRAAVVAIE